MSSVHRKPDQCIDVGSQCGVEAGRDWLELDPGGGQVALETERSIGSRMKEQPAVLRPEAMVAGPTEPERGHRLASAQLAIVAGGAHLADQVAQAAQMGVLGGHL